MATGVIGGFTHSVGQDVADHPELYRETRDGQQLLYLTALFAAGFLQQRPRTCNHLDRSNWIGQDGRVTCRVCKSFLGYERK